MFSFFSHNQGEARHGKKENGQMSGKNRKKLNHTTHLSSQSLLSRVIKKYEYVAENKCLLISLAAAHILFHSILPVSSGSFLFFA